MDENWDVDSFYLYLESTFYTFSLAEFYIACSFLMEKVPEI